MNLGLSAAQLCRELLQRRPDGGVSPRFKYGTTFDLHGLVLQTRGRTCGARLQRGLGRFYR